MDTHIKKVTWMCRAMSTHARRVNPSPWQLLVYEIDYNPQLLVVQHLSFPLWPDTVQTYSKYSLAMNQTTAARVHHRCVRGLCVYVHKHIFVAVSPSIPNGPPVLCIVWPSGAVHFASTKRIDPLPASDRQQANGSGFVPVSRERKEDITCGVGGKRAWIVRNRALKKSKVTQPEQPKHKLLVTVLKTTLQLDVAWIPKACAPVDVPVCREAADKDDGCLWGEPGLTCFVWTISSLVANHYPSTQKSYIALS